MSAALLIDIILWGSVAGVGFIAYQRGPKVLTRSMREGTLDFINIVPRIALGVIGSGYIAAVIPQEIITGWLGPNSGWLGVATAAVARRGDAGRPSGRPFHWRRSVERPAAVRRGCSLFAFQRLLLWEIPFMPARFVWFRAAVSVLFPFLAIAIAMAIGKP